MSDQPPRRGLGRGLSALMADLPDARADAPPAPDRNLAVDALHPNPNQPRKAFDAAALSDLAASIRAKGVIQPLIVRPSPTAPGQHEIVAGERRWRAAREAGLREVPVIVRQFDDTEVLEVAIVENVQRADLNPIEEARAYQALIERFGHTQAQLAEAMGKSRSHISNQMRLTQLPPAVQEMTASGALSTGHARALIGHPEAERLATAIAQRGLTVRETEELAKPPQVGAKRPKTLRVKDEDVLAVERELAAVTGLAVSIEHKSGQKGRVVMQYDSVDQLDDLLRRLSRGRA
ncbi:MAG: ParB/RepB/Spo0J family partition protein [Paracoccaceae bacterium]